MSASKNIISLKVDPFEIDKLRNINIKKVISVANQEYFFFNYDSDYICDNDEETGRYRSVIFNTYQELLSISPFKTLTLDFFKKNFDLAKEEIFVDELIEGTMIQLFWDPRMNEWEIATKKSIGGNYSYFKIPNDVPHISFRSMVLEAFRESAKMDFNKISFLEYFPKEYCYTFVLQHPMNHIVIPVQTPKMYLIAVHKCLNDESIFDEETKRKQTVNVEIISPLEYQTWDIFRDLNGIIHFPNRIYITENQNYDQIINDYASIHTPFYRMGIIFTNLKTGQRCSVINPVYTELKQIRGNHPNLQYQYICLRKIGKINEFLAYFSHYKSIFYKYRDELEDFITNLHQTYFNHYVKKTLKQGTVSNKYYNHIKKIHHDIYLRGLQSAKTKQIITRSVVKQYIESMDPGYILHLLNYEKRQYTIFLEKQL